MNLREQDWPIAATDVLIRLRRRGFSYLEISRRLERKGYRYSRSAVAGRLARLRREGVDLECDTSYSKPTLSTGVVLGTFLDQLCDVGKW